MHDLTKHFVMCVSLETVLLLTHGVPWPASDSIYRQNLCTSAGIAAGLSGFRVKNLHQKNLRDFKKRADLGSTE